MKNYKEMAKDVLRRIGEYEAERQNRRKVIRRVVVPLGCCCLAVLLGIGMWQGGMLDTAPPIISGNQTHGGDTQSTDSNDSPSLNDDKCQAAQTSTTDSKDDQNENVGGKKLFAINEITGTVGAACKLRDPKLHYKEDWDHTKVVSYLGVDILGVINNLPDGDAEAGFPQAYEFGFVESSRFTAVYENDGTLVEDRVCYEFDGKDGAVIKVLASKLGMPYDYLYSSDTDDVTNIRIPATDEIVPVRVYAQGRTAVTDYTLYVGDFEYDGVFYRIRLDNLNSKYLDTLIREIVK